MNIKRRIWALVLSAALVFTYLPAMAFAEDEPSGDQGTTSAAVTDDEVVEPQEATFVSTGLEGIVGTDTVLNLYTKDFEFSVTFADGTQKSYYYGSYTFTDDNGSKYTREGFLLDNGDPKSEASWLEASVDDSVIGTEFKEGFNQIKLYVVVPYVVSGAGTDEEVTTAKVLYANANVTCSADKPIKVKFVPASGFVPQAYVGGNTLNEEIFYGKGNAFEVTYEYKLWNDDGTYDTGEYVASFVYTKKTVNGEVIEGFYDNGNVNYMRFNLADDVDCYLKKGKHTITFPYTEYVEALDKNINLKFTATVAASKYTAYANWPIFDYTGKAVTKKAFAKKLVVRDSTGKKIPASAYTFKWKKNKKMGWYTVKINFKDKTKYIPSIIADYGIGPKAPKVTKVKAGKKKVTVKWKKFTKKELKKIDGMYIEIATDKNFTQNYRSIKLTKKQVKKNKRVIKKLTRNKKYFVRMYTYKKIKQGGEKFFMYSADSNKKKVKTK